MNTVQPRRSTVLVPAGVMLTAAVVALTGTLLAGGSGGEERREKAPAPVGAASPVPYARLSTGDCFDHPGLSGSVTGTERRACAEPHDAEVIARKKLTGTFRSEQQLRRHASAVCEPHTGKRLARVPQDGRRYRTYAVHLSLDTYRQRSGVPVNCAVTLAEERRGPADPKLTAPLPGS